MWGCILSANSQNFPDSEIEYGLSSVKRIELIDRMKTRVNLLTLQNSEKYRLRGKFPSLSID